MTTQQLFTALLGLGGATTIFYSLKSYPKIIFGKIKNYFIFSTKVYDYDELFYVLEMWLNENNSGKIRSFEASYSQVRLGRMSPDISGTSEEDRYNNKKIKILFWKSEPNIFTIKYNGKRIFVNKVLKEVSNAQSSSDQISFHYILSSWSGREVISTLLQDITNQWNKQIFSDKLCIYSMKYDAWRAISERTVKPINKVIINKDIKKAIITDMESFINRRDWYTRVNITYKRTYLLYGPPGTGKTTLAQAMAAYMHKDVCILNINSIISDSALIDAFSQVPSSCVLVIEDIDCAFVQRTAKDTKGVSFSVLLNCLDGVSTKDGLITIITTNHLEKLDPALIREGRIDMKIEMPNAQKEEVNEYLSMFYEIDIDINIDISINMSKVQEICIRNNNYQHAINELNNEKDKNLAGYLPNNTAES